MNAEVEVVEQSAVSGGDIALWILTGLLVIWVVAASI